MSIEATGALAAALAKAQAEMKNAAFNKKNPHFRSSYADLAAVRDAVTPALTANGLAIVQTLDATEAGPVLVTTLLHSSGAQITGRYPLPGNFTDPQKFASAISYSRRYSLAAICNIASEEDDDGNAASEPVNKTRAPAAPEAEAPPRTLSAAEAAVKWVQDSVAKFAKLKTVADLDDWEARNLTAIDKLADNHRDTWAILKRKMTEARTRLSTPALEAAE
jgi:hypothetical protein